MQALANQGRPMVALVWRNAGGQNCPLKIKGFRKKNIDFNAINMN
jgi:hypothetical protein